MAGEFCHLMRALKGHRRRLDRLASGAASGAVRKGLLRQIAVVCHAKTGIALMPFNAYNNRRGDTVLLGVSSRVPREEFWRLATAEARSAVARIGLYDLG